VAREHHPRHALFVRPCASCDKAFDYCGSCQPGRRYCGDVCAADARHASVRRAQSKYNDRDSEEGQAVHRVEEADRRARRSADSVGDHRCREKSGELRARPSTAPHAVSETDAALISPAVIEAPELAGEPALAHLGWILVAWPQLLAAARLRIGTEASCPFCGRQGRIDEVMSIERWRRRSRRGEEV